MGKIKKIILRKQDRPVTEPMPPSMRRVKRMNRDTIESSKAGRNNRLSVSRIVSLKGLRRSQGDRFTPGNTFTQKVPETAVFRYKKKYRPMPAVVHEHYSGSRQDDIGIKKVKFISCRTDDSVTMADFESLEKAGLGKIEIKKARVIRHRIDKQDDNFKFHKHDVKY